MRQTENDPVLRTRALAGLKRYQNATRPTRPPAPVVHATAQTAKLLHFQSGSGDNNTPIVLIPSLINPPDVLDLSEKTSLMRWLAARGHNAFLVDWGHPAADAQNLGLADHVAQQLLPLLQSLDNGQPPILVGYCLGGTLAAGAAACMSLSALVTIAAPWNFSGFPEASRRDIVRLWAGAKPLCQRLGYVPMEVLQSGFWSLDPARTIAKYAEFGEMEEGSEAEAAFITLEDWANAGPPLTYAAGQELFEKLYEQDATASGFWAIGDTIVRPQDFDVPTLAICSSTDRIVPAGSAPPLAEKWLLDMGHVGMIVGRRAPQSLWVPLSEWLFKHERRC